jgi:hydroxymethylbilane synthase
MSSQTKKIRIATRGSQLALWQANYVSGLLQQQGITSELVTIKTTGDRVQDRFLHEIGGKGLFVRELEKAMDNGDADIAVHSLKDLPAKTPEGFLLPAILKRHNPHDAMIFKPATYERLAPAEGPLKPGDLKDMGAMTIATSSLRRQALLKALQCPLKMVPVRGNVDTRLEKLKAENWDALILAAASLERLGLNELPYRLMATDWYVPCAAQGALAIECPKGSPHESVLRLLTDPATEKAATIERRILAELGGDCTMPFGAFITHDAAQNQSTIHAVVLDYEGHEARYCEAFPGQVTELNTETVVANTIKGLKADGLKPILKALDVVTPDLGRL